MSHPEQVREQLKAEGKSTTGEPEGEEAQKAQERRQKIEVLAPPDFMPAEEEEEGLFAEPAFEKGDPQYNRTPGRLECELPEGREEKEPKVQRGWRLKHGGQVYEAVSVEGRHVSAVLLGPEGKVPQGPMPGTGVPTNAPSFSPPNNAPVPPDGNTAPPATRQKASQAKAKGQEKGQQGGEEEKPAGEEKKEEGKEGEEGKEEEKKPAAQPQPQPVAGPASLASKKAAQFQQQQSQKQKEQPQQEGADKGAAAEEAPPKQQGQQQQAAPRQQQPGSRGTKQGD